jgi:hypothetical protein
LTWPGYISVIKKKKKKKKRGQVVSKHIYQGKNNSF